MSAIPLGAPAVSLRDLLSPDGRPWRTAGYVIGFAYVTHLGRFLALWQRDDYWMFWVNVMAAVTAAVFVLALLWGIARFAPRMPLVAAGALAIVVGLLGNQMLFLWIGFGTSPSDPDYWYRVGFFRQSLIPWFMGGAAWYMLRRNEGRERRLHEAKMAGARLDTGIAEARLRALQAQVEPHFLFNTLAHVRWLYRRDPAKASRMLDRFLIYLQAALPQMREKEPTLGQEVQLACAYLEVQKIRMGERLTFDVEIPDGLLKLRFPPMMLISLVENAVKHGLSPLREGGAIHIGAVANPGRLRVEVRDTGVGLGTCGGSGIGLANIRTRLEALFGNAARLDVRPDPGRGVSAAIEVPCQ